MSLRAKTEAAYNTSTSEDEEKKVENGPLGGALIGGGIGAAIGGVAGALFGGAPGAAIGAVAGGLVGAGIGALIGAVSGGPSISWKPANYSSDNANGNSTTTEQPFDVQYSANRDEANGLWQLQVDSIEGGADIEVHTGGSRDPFANPPTTEAEAQTAVNVMKGYYSRGSRGPWHTEAASQEHEMHHYREWKCSSEHYWPTASAAIHSLMVPLSAHTTEAQAIAAMRSGTDGADAKLQSFRDISHQYWFTLSDSAGSRPYAAGQLELNNAITHVQSLANRQGWTVPSGTDSPNPDPPCYQPWLPYNP